MSVGYLTFWFVFLTLSVTSGFWSLWLMANFWIGPKRFLELLAKEAGPVVVFYKRKPWFRPEPHYGYFTCVKGVRFFTRTSKPLDFPPGCELVEIPRRQSWTLLYGVQKQNE